MEEDEAWACVGSNIEEDLDLIPVTLSLLPSIFVTEELSGVFMSQNLGL